LNRFRFDGSVDNYVQLEEGSNLVVGLLVGKSMKDQMGSKTQKIIVDFGTISKRAY
jgi:ABC-type sugar transport system substrate-binding protein